MTAPAAGLESAIAEALEESQFPVEGGLEQDLATFDAELAQDDDDPAESPSTAEAPQLEDSDEAEAETPADVPDSYWGVDLTGIPVEKRAAIIEHLSQQDGTIRKLQAKLSEPLEAADAPAVEDTPEVTDAQLLEFYGVDPDAFDVSDAMKSALIKQGRNQLALEDQVARLSNLETGRSVESKWNRELDELEATYGNLPGSREEVLRFALREEVLTPADLYFKLTAPVKREVESLAAKARREAGKREQSAGVKPRNSSAEPAPVQPGMSMRDAVKAAAMDAQKETGLSWKTALKRHLTGTPESSE
jgi:hypothetical protein